MRIHNQKTWKQYQIQVAQEWRERHHLPKVSDSQAAKLYWTIPKAK